MTTAPPLLPDTELAAQPAPRRSRAGRDYVRGSRGTLMIIGALIVVAVLAALTSHSAETAGTMDPRSYSPDGGRALATLLSQRGVPVTLSRSLSNTVGRVNRAAAGGSATTVVVADPSRE